MWPAIHTCTSLIKVIFKFTDSCILLDIGPDRHHTFITSICFFWPCGSHVVYPIINRLIPSPSRFQTRQWPSDLWPGSSQRNSPLVHTCCTCLPCRLLVFDNLFSWRLTGNKKSDANDESIDSVLQYHQNLQENIAEEMIKMAQHIKHTSVMASNIIKEDNKVTGMFVLS